MRQRRMEEYLGCMGLFVIVPVILVISAVVHVYDTISDLFKENWDED